MRERELAVQMGGPVGARAPAVALLVADQLGLAEPVMPWHTTRVRAAALACALAVLAGVFGKVGRDVTLLAQDEVGEVREGGDSGGGGSTAMAHKYNPVAAVSVIACARRTPALAGTMLSAPERHLGAASELIDRALAAAGE